MKNAKHTPGPWTIEGEDPRQIGKVIRDANGNDICELASAKNVHLIASAPDLMAAAEWCLKMFKIQNETTGHNNYEVGMLERAIAKATGGAK